MHGPPLLPPPPPPPEEEVVVTGAEGVTERVVEAVVVPDVLPQAILKTSVVAIGEVNGPMVSEPVTDLLPDHGPLATQSEAFDEFQESVAVFPEMIAVGLTEKADMVLVAVVVVPESLSKFTIDTSDGFTPFQLISTLVIEPRRILYVIFPSTIVSSTPVTYTV
jgi:hypothetical protein